MNKLLSWKLLSKHYKMNIKLFKLIKIKLRKLPTLLRRKKSWLLEISTNSKNNLKEEN